MQPNSFGVVIGTYGSDEWDVQGSEAVMRLQQTGLNTVHVHGDSLAEARNTGVALCDTEYVCCMDADDNLDPYFGAAFQRVMHKEPKTLYQVSTLGWYGGDLFDDYSVLLPTENMYVTNGLIVGTVFDRQGFLNVGGFSELQALEDWELWLRMISEGYKIRECRQMVYHVKVNNDGRNQNATQETYQSIYRAYTNNRVKDYLWTA